MVGSEDGEIVGSVDGNTLGEALGTDGVLVGGSEHTGRS